jgi:predicted hydrolase (HD superfamily)
MGWFADTLGFGADKAYWSLVGLLHDIDYELYPRSTAGKRRSSCGKPASERI